ncbi:hypothetical protein [Polyangium spumosum]|uniref:Uncharacterized protein n=1 Tax=Polyangium spumosum TaxID=889282 RepID=A0A6N7PK62_9BACT|nr:hypothetical protein [Polyangium spumosum]MRG92197.1 hypothetical protein [Polyangium spumosum]
MKWLDDIEQAKSEGFDDLEGRADVPGQALAESRHWARTLFAQGMSPYDAGRPVRRAVHRATKAAPDLLRHEYDVDDLHLSIVEGRSFALVVVARASLDVLALPEEERAPAIARIAKALFHPVCVSGGACFRFPERIEEGTFFSTNPELDPRLLGAWQDRLDAGIRGGELVFLAYKRLPWMAGFADPSSWLREGERIDQKPRFRFPFRSSRSRRKKR